MSTTQEDQQVAARVATLAILALLTVPALAVSGMWFTNMGNPQLWQLVAGPVALTTLVVLMRRVLRALPRSGVVL